MHPIARAGFGAQVAAYEAARPSYPPEVVAHILSLLPARTPPRPPVVLDLAAGTGKFTRLLLPHGAPPVLAVEPVAAMREELRRACPGARVEEGLADRIPAGDGDVDLVTVAQAFHWFATEAALREIRRVLRPGGLLALVWNLEDRARADWVGRLRDCYEAFEGDTPQYRLGLWRPLWGGAAAAALFSPLEHRAFRNDLHASKEVICQRVLTKSYIAAQPEDVRRAVAGNVRAVLEGVETEAVPGGDGGGGGEQQLVLYPHTTDVFTAYAR